MLYYTDPENLGMLSKIWKCLSNCFRFSNTPKPIKRRISKSKKQHHFWLASICIWLLENWWSDLIKLKYFLLHHQRKFIIISYLNWWQEKWCTFWEQWHLLLHWLTAKNLMIRRIIMKTLICLQILKFGDSGF